MVSAPAMDLEVVFAAVRRRLALLLLGPLAAGLAALGVTYLIPPTFTASTSFIPPLQQQSGAASALASLGSLASLAGGPAVRSPGEQYVSLLQSVSVSDRLIERFKLLQVYDVDYRIDARRELAKNVRIALGKKDGLIFIEVDDKQPQRAADLANAYIEELRHMTKTLAVSEAQQRRVFFEQQMQQARDRLVQAQLALQSSGFNSAALNAEPRAAAEGYAKLRADATMAEVRLQALRRNLTDSAPEVAAQSALLSALRGQLAKVEVPADGRGGADYVGRYREYKYQETLFELNARQYELARLDEGREGGLIQVVDAALPPEKKSKPRRLVISAVTVVVAAAALLGWVLLGARRTARRAAGLHDPAA